MKYSVYLSLMLLSAAPTYLESYCSKALKEFAKKGYSTCCQDFTNADLSPIIKDLTDNPPLWYRLRRGSQNFITVITLFKIIKPGGETCFINLSGALLSGAILSNVDLRFSNLDGIICDEITDFSGSTFAGGNVIFSYAETSGSFDLHKAKLDGARMSDWQIVEYLEVNHNTDQVDRSWFLCECDENCPVKTIRREKNIKMARINK